MNEDILDNAPPCSLSALLSEREREVLSLFLAEKTQKEIGHLMGISQKTVADYKRRIQEKLGVANSVALIKYAVRHGLEEWLSPQNAKGYLHK